MQLEMRLEVIYILYRNIYVYYFFNDLYILHFFNIIDRSSIIFYCITLLIIVIVIKYLYWYIVWLLPSFTKLYAPLVPDVIISVSLMLLFHLGNRIIIIYIIEI